MGDEVMIYQEFSDWYKGVNISCDSEGIFPKNHIQIISADENEK